jgi:opacity protein-like surface antigen
MRFFSRVVTVLAVFAAGVASAAAQSVAEPKSVTVTPFLSGSFGTSNDLGSSLGLGVGVGYDLTRNIGFEFDLGRVFDVAGDDDNIDYKMVTISFNAIYHFDMKRVTPYATLGLGWENADLDVENIDPLALYPPSTTEVAWNFGGGVKYPINERLLARADIRRFQVNDLTPDHWRLYGGLTFWLKR